jgi:hypothetical protein
MVTEVAAIQSPVISAIKQEFGSLASAEIGIANAIPDSLPLPAAAPNDFTEITNTFSDTLKAGELLRDDFIDRAFTSIDNNIQSNTAFQAQLIAQNLETNPVGTITAENISAENIISNTEQLQTIETPSTGTFNQLVANTAYHNIQAVAIAEPVVIDPQVNVFNNGVKEIEEYSPTNSASGFGGAEKRFETFAAMQDFLASLSANINPKSINPVEETINNFAKAVGLEPENNSTSLLV